MSSVESKIDVFMQQEMPQIKMHGGDWQVIDVEDGVAEIVLEDACSGCGISPMTIQALKKRMPKSIEEVSEVVAKTESLEDPTDGPF